jgi:uncharacterized membrane protein
METQEASMTETKKHGLMRTLRNQFVEGLLVIIPLGATVLILIWLFTSIDNILQPFVRAIWGQTIPGVGFFATLVLIYLTGVITANFIGKRLLHYGEALLGKVPVVRPLYTGIKQILESFSDPNKTGFMQVVLVEFPRKGMMALAFITNEVTTAAGEKLLTVLIPTAPNPATGFLQIMKEADVIRTKMSVDDAIKMIVSAGRITPQEARDKLSASG